YFTPSGQPYYSATRLRVGYTGREMLVNTWGGLGAGLYDYRNRIYSTVHGRFLQPDPIGFDAGDVNWYRYVGNNAVNYKDSHGLRKTYEDQDGAGKAGSKKAWEMQKSDKDRYEYCGKICKKCPSGPYYYTGPIRGGPGLGQHGKGSCRPQDAPDCDPGDEWVAYYHSHDSSRSFSDADYNYSESYERDGYVGRDKPNHGGKQSKDQVQIDHYEHKNNKTNYNI
ncbi:MAG: hypothetical protein NZM04_08005, partial [Methylacidiphilales bacterium]|nr:hypothetical protein [Candidatus Methylacidiphilales bacterium]